MLELKIEMEAATEYRKALESNTLIEVEFESVFDYLFLLRAIGEAITPLGRNVILYLAAAVSDFYIPMEEMVKFAINLLLINGVINIILIYP